MRFLFMLAFLIAPATLWASCGTDLRSTLTPAQNSEIASRIADQPYAVGNHWTATKGTRTINLIGTMHIDDPRMDAVAERLRSVIEAADILLVEATEADQKALERAMATQPELAFLSGETLIDLMPADEWAELAEAAAARGIPGFMAAKFQPWYLSLMLALSPCTLQDVVAGAKGLDHRLMQMAQGADVPMESLEPNTTLFELFGSDPIEDQIALLRLGVLPDALAEDATATLAEQYFEEDILAGLETSRVLTRPAVDLPVAEFDAIYDEFMDLLLRQRNETWMAPIEAAKGARIVIAAGALHLGGTHGILKMLEQRGYTLQRQPF